MNIAAPSKDVVEVTTIGPNFGECIIVHLGDGNWMIIDSCFDSTSKSSASLKYLQELNVDVATAVKLIVITHWHGDHVGGISETIRACRTAEVCLSPIYDNKQFAEEVVVHTSGSEPRIGSALREAKEVFDIRTNEPFRTFKAAGVDRRVRTWAGTSLTHGRDIDVYTLSPADAQLNQFISKLATLASPNGKIRGRARVPSPNESSVVVWVQIGEIAILLGADLEEAGTMRSWSAILDSTGRPQTRAQIFKIAHHGSITGDHPRVWQDMLSSDAYSVVTPWMLASGHLPLVRDLRRIRGYTRNGFLSSISRQSQFRATSQPVAKTLREMGRPIVEMNQRAGFVTFRNDGLKNFNDWTVSLSPMARAI